MCQPYKRRFKGGISTNIQLTRSPDDGHVMGFEKLRRELMITVHIEISGDYCHRKQKMMEKQIGVSSLSIQNTTKAEWPFPCPSKDTCRFTEVKFH